MAHYQTDEMTFPRLLLRTLCEESELFEQTKRAFMVAGTVLRIYKSNDIICSFLLEDFTRAQVVEVFRDRLPPGFVVELGDVLEMKGNLVLNKFNERVIRILKVRRVTLNEEIIHYLEILQTQKQRSPQGFGEETVLVHDGEAAARSRVQYMPNDDQLRKKIFSIIFTFGMKNWQKFKDAEGLVRRSQLLEMPELTAIKAKVTSANAFDKVFEDVLSILKGSQIVAVLKKDVVLNLDFFENFDDNFLYQLNQEVDNEFSYKKLYCLFNDLIYENFNNMINKECVYEYINKLIFRKKLTPVENKKEVYRRI